MTRVTCKLGAASAIVAFAATSAIGASASACENIVASGEIASLSIGDIVFASSISRKAITILSIDKDAEEICSDTSCYDANDLYTENGVEACREAALEGDPLDVGIIFLYQDEEDEDGDEDEDAPATSE